MRSRLGKSGSGFSRRDVFRTGALATTAEFLGKKSAMAETAPVRTAGDNVYTRIGVRPFINMTAALTINGGLLTLPEVKQAMEEASHYSVNIDELMEKVGERLAQLLGGESGIVTAGSAAALTHATAACVAGGDPEKIQQLPSLAGLKDQVIMPKQSRNVYDHAIRTVGVRIVVVDSREEFQEALGKRAAMIAVLGSGEAEGKIRLEEMAEAGHKAGVPVLVDAAAEIPVKPNPYLSRGADLVAYSGGKFMSGPQCSGLLLGRKDLVRAAWINSAPHHAFGRAMKVGKEEIMGLLAAVETLMNKRDIQTERRTWESWFAHISEKISRVPGVRTKMLPPPDTNPHPILGVEWDPDRIGLTAGELHRLLLEGEPRIMSQAAGEGRSFPIRAAGMKPGDYKLVAERLYEIFSKAAPGKAQPAPAPPAVDVAGRWDVKMDFVAGSSTHTLFLQTAGNRVTGSHLGRSLQGDLSGMINGQRIRMHSSFAFEGARLTYSFAGSVEGDRMSGEVGLGEYGRARWTARRHQAGAAA